MGELKTLSIAHVEGNKFELIISMIVDFLGYSEDDADSEMLVNGKAIVEFEGIRVAPDNLFPKPQTQEAINQIVSNYLDLENFEEPEKEGFSWVMRPK